MIRPKKVLNRVTECRMKMELILKMMAIEFLGEENA